jgi:hypothetical protein
LESRRARNRIPVRVDRFGFRVDMHRPVSHLTKAKPVGRPHFSPHDPTHPTWFAVSNREVPGRHESVSKRRAGGDSHRAAASLPAASSVAPISACAQSFPAGRPLVERAFVLIPVSDDA